MPKQNIIDSLKQILREVDQPVCVNWAHASLVVRSNAPTVSANDSSYGSAAPKSVRGNVKKGAIAA